MDHTIWAEGLVKRFGETTALDGVDLGVRTGTVLGLLGPNGRGKTTAVRVLATLLTPDAGHATGGRLRRRPRGPPGPPADRSDRPVRLGRRDPDRHGEPAADRPAAGSSGRRRRRGPRELLDEFGLADAADRAAKTYSGGMRRRLDLAASLVGRPRMLFLDEPTTGLDPGRGSSCGT